MVLYCMKATKMNFRRGTTHEPAIIASATAKCQEIRRSCSFHTKISPASEAEALNKLYKIYIHEILEYCWAPVERKAPNLEPPICSRRSTLSRGSKPESLTRATTSYYSRLSSEASEYFVAYVVKMSYNPEEEIKKISKLPGALPDESWRQLVLELQAPLQCRQLRHANIVRCSNFILVRKEQQHCITRIHAY